MIIVEEWVTASREARTAHLDMSEPCIERGGNSTVHRGVLAQYLGTNIPNKIDLCHNCGNGKCSNPKHLYWGTRKENVEDAKRHGSWKTGWEKMVTKYGYDEACKIKSDRARGNTHGSGNKGKPKTDEHRMKISASLKGGKLKGWKKNNAQVSQSAEEADSKSA